MPSITFQMSKPYDQIPRMLDLLRTMGFELKALSVGNEREGHYRVGLTYEPRGHLSEQTFLERLARQNATSAEEFAAGAFHGSLDPTSHMSISR